MLSSNAFVLRLFDGHGRDRLLMTNLGRDLVLDPIPEPLVAPPRGHRWVVRWSSEDARYGGNGTPALESEGIWRLPGETTVLLVPEAGATT